MLTRMCVLVLVAVAAVSLASAGEPAAEAKTERHIIYVPYETLDKVFQAEDKGVFLPYSEFKVLWDFFRKHHIAGLEDKPPVPALISRALYELSVADEAATGTATLSIESLEAEWVSLPLPFRGIALSEATLDGKPLLLRATANGYELLLHEAGKHTLVLKFAVKVESRPGRKGVSFNVPLAALAKVDVALPDGDVKLDVDHLISSQKSERDGVTTLSAFLGPTDTVRVGWQPKEVERETIPPLLHAKTTVGVTVTEGLMRARAVIHYDVMRAPAERFSVLLPTELNLLDVAGQQIKTWNVEDTAQGKVLTVELHEPVEKAYALTIEVERILTGTDLTLAAPRIEATGENVAREIGTLTLAAGKELRLKVVSTTGLARIDLAEAGAPPKDWPAPLYAYRYWEPGWAATFSVEKVLPRVQADVVALTTIDKRAMSLHADVTYTVEDAGIFQLAVRIPADLKVRDVGPSEIVESHTVAAEGEWQTINVLLKEKRLGAFTINIFAERKRLSAFTVNIFAERTRLTDFADRDTAALPEVTVLGVERETGMVGLAAHAGYEASPTDVAENLIQIPKPEFLKRRGVSGAQEFRLAYRYAEHPYSATVALTKRSPQVSAQVDAVVGIAEDTTTLTYLITYSIRYAGIKELKFKIDPEATEALDLDPSKLEHFQINGPAIRHRDYLEDGVWQITLDGEQTGRYALTVTAKAGTDLLKIDSGATPKTAIPMIEVKETMGIFQETGHVAVWKSLNLDVATQPGKDLEVQDRIEMPPALQSDLFAKGFRYLKHTPEVGLAVGVITYEAAEIVAAQVVAGHYDMVVSLEGKLTVEAVYSILNNREQFFRIVLPDTAKIYAASVSGASSTTQKGDTGERLIKIPRQADAPFTVRLVYETEMPGGTMGAAGALKLGVPKINMEVSRLSVRLYLPERYTYLRFHGTIPRVDDYTQPGALLDDIMRRAGAVPALSGGYRIRQGHGDAVWGPEYDPAQRRPDELTAGATMPIAKEGVSYSFMKLGGDGELRVRYWRTGWWTFWQIVAVVVVIAAGVCLCKWTRLRRLAYLLGALVVITIFFSFSIAEAWVALFRWAFGGLVILAIAWLIVGLTPAIQARRAAAAAASAEAAAPAGGGKGGE